MIKKFCNWAQILKLWDVNWSLTHTQTLSFLQKQDEVKQKMVFANYLVKYDSKPDITNRFNSFYYSRRLNESVVEWEWHKLIALWQKVKWRNKKRILFYTDIFDDYPLVRHLAKQLDEGYSVGWYPGLNSNRHGLKKLRYTRLAGKIEVSQLPSIILTFSTFYPISHTFLKEFGRFDIFYISFVSLGDIHLPSAFLIHLTKTYPTFYFYVHLIYSIIQVSDNEKGAQLTALKKFVSVSSSARARRRWQNNTVYFGRWGKFKSAGFRWMKSLRPQWLRKKAYGEWRRRRGGIFWFKYRALLKTSIYWRYRKSLFRIKTILPKCKRQFKKRFRRALQLTGRTTAIYFGEKRKLSHCLPRTGSKLKVTKNFFSYGRYYRTTTTKKIQFKFTRRKAHKH